jgi:hypothetical protein
VDLVDAEAGVGVVRLVPPGGADMRGWVDAGRGHGCMVVGGGVDMCARQLILVVGGLCPRHPVPGGLHFRAIPRWVRAVFAMKHAVISARLLRPSVAPATRAIVAALGGDNLDSERPRRRGAEVKPGPSRAMMKDLAIVASSPPDDATAT